MREEESKFPNILESVEVLLAVASSEAIVICIRNGMCNNVQRTRQDSLDRRQLRPTESSVSFGSGTIFSVASVKTGFIDRLLLAVLIAILR